MPQEDTRSVLAARRKLPMTIALGLLGSNGWVLASDTKALQTTNILIDNTPPSLATFSSSTGKICWDEKAKIIYAYSGTHIGRLAAAKICEKSLSTWDADRALLCTETANQTFAEFAQSRLNDQDMPRAILIFTEPRLEMWSVHIRDKSEAIQHLDKALIGDVHNGAKLFPSLYHSTQQPVERLLRLAAHTVLMGHSCAPGEIDGLDIWTGDRQGHVRQLNEVELASMRKVSRSLDKTIRRRF
jgi:hypothetical protein